MDSLLRSRFARFVLLAAFMIPMGTTSLRGLTHVLTCSDVVPTPFAISIPDEGQPIVTTSSFIDREAPQDGCDGLNVEIGARLTEDDHLDLVLPLSNSTKFDWQGTIQVAVDGISVPVDIGGVPAGETVERVVTLELPEGTHELSGTLLVGP